MGIQGGSVTTESADVGTKASSNEESKDTNDKEKEFTFDDVLNNLQKNSHLVELLLDNIRHYCQVVSDKVKEDPSQAGLSRSQQRFAFKLFSH